MKMSIATAQLFLDAFDGDRISVWCHALQAAEEEKSLTDNESALGAASLGLRQAWWHDGSQAAREKVHRAAERLRNVIEESTGGAHGGQPSEN